MAEHNLQITNIAEGFKFNNSIILTSSSINLSKNMQELNFVDHDIKITQDQVIELLQLASLVSAAYNCGIIHASQIDVEENDSYLRELSLLVNRIIPLQSNDFTIE